MKNLIKEEKSGLKNLSDISKKEKFHFIGLGGIGMSALARILLEAGFKVSGSDLNKNHLTEYFEKQSAEVYTGHSQKNLQNVSFVIQSSAIKQDNPEFKKAMEEQIPIIHRAELLNAIMCEFGRVSVGITGTHGKTTTTGMVTTIFKETGYNPGFAIGGEIPHLKTNSAMGNGEYFVSELDESDGTIELYNPDITIITNLELEHTDYYKDGFDQLLGTFNRFLDDNSDSKIIINIDDAGNNSLINQKERNNFIKYSLKDKEADYYASVVQIVPNIQIEAYKKGEYLGEFKANVPGYHNASNALAAVAAGIEAGLKPEEVSKGLSVFSGMKKRFQTLGYANGARIIDDYAHHPTEINATIKTAKAVADLNKDDRGRVIAVFQPHRYTRFEKFWNEFLNCFDDADLLYICDVYSAEEKPIENINSQEFLNQIKKENSFYVKGALENVADEVIKQIRPNDMVLTMGAGTITKLGPVIIEKTNGNS